MSEKKKTGWEIMVLVLMLPFYMAWKGYAVKVLWAWFLVPLGVVAISTSQAVGLTLLWTFMSMRNQKMDSQSTGDLLFFAFASPAFALLLGWFIKQFL